MSDPIPAATNPVRNLNYLRVAWNGTTFDCTAKNPPAFKDLPSWTILTDNPLQLTGETISGKSEGLDPIEVTIESDISQIYGSLQAAYLAGTEASATFTYQETGGTASTVTVPKCKLVGLTPGGGDNNSNSTTVLKFQPKGGVIADLPAAT